MCIVYGFALFVNCCMLIALLFGFVLCLLVLFYCLLFVVGELLYDVRCVLCLCVLGCSLFVACCSLLVLRCALSVVGCCLLCACFLLVVFSWFVIVL